MAKFNPNRANPPERFLTVTKRRKYGAVDIEFGVTAPYTPENEGDQQRAWLMLEAQVNDMLDEWAKNQLPKEKHLETPITMKEYTAGVAVKTEDGRVKVATIEPDYSKYGVVVPAELHETMSKFLHGDGNVFIPGVKVLIEKRERGAIVVGFRKD